MSEDINSDPIKLNNGEGTERNSAEHSEYQKANNELGQEMDDVGENKDPVNEELSRESSPPLFLADSSEGNKGNAQDEKDESEE